MLLPFSFTPAIAGENAISEFRTVKINGTHLVFLIRGENRTNPVILFVHGGPGCSEIPYVVKYQRELEKYFTIVHYDQRGSGKSYHFGEDYSDLYVSVLIKDLTCCIEYVCDFLKKDKIIVAAHSYGTEIATRTLALYPEKVQAYIGIGQMAYTNQSEKEGWNYCLNKARSHHQPKDCQRLLEMKEQIDAGKTAVPRKIIKKYGGKERLINSDLDYLFSFLLRPEYSAVDMVRFVKGLFASARLFGTAEGQTAEEVKALPFPVYILQGKYDYMTSTKIAKRYYDELEAPEKEFVLFEKSGHFPQFEENDKYAKWLIKKFVGGETRCPGNYKK